MARWLTEAFRQKCQNDSHAPINGFLKTCRAAKPSQMSVSVQNGGIRLRVELFLCPFMSTRSSTQLKWERFFHMMCKQQTKRPGISYYTCYLPGRVDNKQVVFSKNVPTFSLGKWLHCAEKTHVRYVLVAHCADISNREWLRCISFGKGQWPEPPEPPARQVPGCTTCQAPCVFEPKM